MSSELGAGKLGPAWACIMVGAHLHGDKADGWSGFTWGRSGSCMKETCQGMEQTAAVGGDVHGWRRKQLEGMREKHGLLGCCSRMRAGKKPKPSLEGKKEDQVLRCAWTKRKPCKRAG